MTGRVRKFDQYIHNPARSKRQSASKESATRTRIVEAPVKSQTQFLPRPKSVVTQSQPIVHKQVQARNTSKDIALQSVADSKERTDNHGYVVQQFSDEQVVDYAPVKSKTSKLSKAMYALGLFVFVFAIFTSVQSFLFNNQAREQVAALGVNSDEQGASEGTGSDPSEEPVSNSAIANYFVTNPEDPRYIRIPDLGLMARVKNLGIDSSGAVDAPGNINDAGWYNGSARPGGEYGSSLVLGHVSGWTAPGIFKKVDSLKPGSVIEIEKGSGERIQYMVKQTRSVKVDQIDMSEILTPDNPNEAELNLMTCSGKYNRETDTYEERLVIQAIKI